MEFIHTLRATNIIYFSISKILGHFTRIPAFFRIIMITL